jgi:hypothetical protein
MRKIYHVRLFGEERGYLEELVRVGKAAARTLMHARILLKADEGPGGPLGVTTRSLTHWR